MKIWLPSIRARSGADVYVERLAEALHKHGVEPVVQWFPHAYQYAPWLLRGQPSPPDIDLINAVSWVAFAFRRHDIPLVVTAHHCVAGHGYPEWKSFQQMLFHDKLVRRFERASFQASGAIVAVSDSTRNDVRDDFDVRANVHVIPNWVDTSVFSPGSAQTKAASRKTRILIVGNMSRRKGGDLIGPFCDALGQDFDVTVITGLRDEKPRTSAKSANLRFTSRLTTDQIVAAYRDTDIVASLSRHEGFGYTALEGMACGKPVVSFDVSGLRDVIADGETGLLVPAEDVVTMASACRRLQDDGDLSVRFGELGRERAITVFSEENAIDAHLRLYRDLISRRERRA